MHKKYNTKYSILVNPRLVMTSKHKSFLSDRKRNKEKLQFGYQSTYIALLGVIAFLLLYYVWILNANATQGYTIRELENTGKELKVELERLDVKIAELESSDGISSDEDLQNIMEEYEDPNYLVIRDNIQYVYNY
ncbi:hypothetical protein LR010_01650 [Candidatus Gracilibacteria bacterium]|nr:hypothetical protein [Candidatus Gracilibacteria bacterium]